MVWFRLAAIIFIAATVTGGSGQAWAQRRFGRHVLISALLPGASLSPPYQAARGAAARGALSL